MTHARHIVVKLLLAPVAVAVLCFGASANASELPAGPVTVTLPATQSTGGLGDQPPSSGRQPPTISVEAPLVGSVAPSVPAPEPAASPADRVSQMAAKPEPSAAAAAPDGPTPSDVLPRAASGTRAARSDDLGGNSVGAKRASGAGASRDAKAHAALATRRPLGPTALVHPWRATGALPADRVSSTERGSAAELSSGRRTQAPHQRLLASSTASSVTVPAPVVIGGTILALLVVLIAALTITAVTADAAGRGPRHERWRRELVARFRLR